MMARLRLMQYHADPGDAGRIRGEDSGGLRVLRAKVYGYDAEERDLYGRAMASAPVLMDLLEEWVGDAVLDGAESNLLQPTRAVLDWIRTSNQ